MVYPNNSLSVSYTDDENYCLFFNALDALQMVDSNKLPGIEVLHFILSFPTFIAIQY